MILLQSFVSALQKLRTNTGGKKRIKSVIQQPGKQRYGVLLRGTQPVLGLESRVFVESDAVESLVLGRRKETLQVQQLFAATPGADSGDAPAARHRSDVIHRCALLTLCHSGAPPCAPPPLRTSV